MNITRNQWFAIAGVVLSALMTSTAFLTDTFGPGMAKAIIGSAGFANMILQGITTILSTQTQQVKDVAAMPGVERIAVNTQASAALAAVAVDTDQKKVGGVDAETQQTLKTKAAS